MTSYHTAEKQTPHMDRARTPPEDISLPADSGPVSGSDLKIVTKQRARKKEGKKDGAINNRLIIRIFGAIQMKHSDSTLRAHVSNVLICL